MIDGEELQRAVGRVAKQLRLERGLSQADVAAHARRLGATWRQTAVRDIEGGRRSPTVETLLLLASSLAALDPHRRPVTLADLVPTEGTILLTDELSVPAGEVAQMLAGGPVSLAVPDPSLPDPSVLPGPAPLEEDLRQVVGGWQLTDERAARKLGLEDDAAQVLMARNLGASVSESSAWFVGEGASSQQKAAMTRIHVHQLAVDLTICRAFERGAPGYVERTRALDLPTWKGLSSAVFMLAAEESRQGVEAAIRYASDPAFSHSVKFSLFDSIEWMTPGLLRDLLGAVEDVFDR